MAARGVSCGVSRGNTELTSQDFHGDRHLRLGPHRAALEDSEWAVCWRDVIDAAALEGKVVLDLHAGLGFRSLLAARAGAIRVYAVEPTWLADVCAEVVTANGYAGVVTVIRHRIGKGLSLPTTVDAILCPWIGPAGLYSSLVESVIWARDRFLAADGIVLPNRSAIHVVGAKLTGFSEPHPDTSTTAFSWRAVHGFDLSAIEAAKSDSVSATTSREVDGTEYVAATTKRLIHQLNVMECSLRDTSFDTDFTVYRRAVVGGEACAARIDGVVLSVEVHFDHCRPPRIFASGSPGTHIRDVFYPVPASIASGAPGESLRGGLHCEHRRSDRPSGRSSCDVWVALGASPD